MCFVVERTMMRPIWCALLISILQVVPAAHAAPLIIGGLANQYVYTSPYDFSSDKAATEVVGFTWFNGGFIASIKRWITLNIVAPVGGVINFNNSPKGFFLKNDLFLARTATWINSGYFNGDGNAIVLSNNLAYASRLQFVGDTLLEGSGNVVTLQSGGVFGVSAGVTLTLRNMTLIMEQGSALILASATSKIIFDNVTVVWKQNFEFAAGLLECRGTCRFTSSQKVALVFSTPGTLTINSYSSLRLYSQILFKCMSPTQREPIVFVDRTSVLSLAGGEISSGGQSIVFSKGTLVVKRGGLLSTTQDRYKICFKQAPAPEQLFLLSNPNVLRGSLRDGVVYAQWI
jgi:hypothetical protein